MSQNIFIQPYANTSTIYPENLAQLSPLLTKTIQDIAIRVNFRTIGIFEKFQVVTGEQWFNNVKPQDKRQTYRQTYEFILTHLGNTQTPHNINFSSTGQFTRIYGTLTSGGNFYPLPYVDVLIGPGAEVQLNCDTQFINVATNYAPFVGSKIIIVLEYLL